MVCCATSYETMITSRNVWTLLAIFALAATASGQEASPAKCAAPPECIVWNAQEILCCLGDSFTLDCRIEVGPTDEGSDLGFARANCELDWGGKAECPIVNGKPLCDFTALARNDSVPPEVVDRTKFYLDSMCFGLGNPGLCPNPDPQVNPTSNYGCDNWGNEASPGSQEFECQYLRDWEIECDIDIAALSQPNPKATCELDPPEFDCPIDLAAGKVLCDWNSPDAALFGPPDKKARAKAIVDYWCPTEIKPGTEGNNEDSTDSTGPQCPGIPLYQQCGGQGAACDRNDPSKPCVDGCWPGGCEGQLLCARQNEWYYQCLESGPSSCPYVLPVASGC